MRKFPKENEFETEEEDIELLKHFLTVSALQSSGTRNKTKTLSWKPFFMQEFVGWNFHGKTPAVVLETKSFFPEKSISNSFLHFRSFIIALPRTQRNCVYVELSQDWDVFIVVTLLINSSLWFRSQTILNVKWSLRYVQFC